MLRENGPQSRFDLSLSSMLSIATTKRLVEELLADGLLMEGEADSRPGRGRKASLLQLESRYGYAIGVSITAVALEIHAVDFNGRSVASWQIAPKDFSREGLQESIAGGLRDAVSSCRSAGNGPLLGIGAGIAGLVNAREGIVVYCPGLEGWENVDLASFLSKCGGAEAVIDDEVRCMALAEKRYGSARELDTFLFIYIGSGVGSGIILDNRIYRGTHGVSGEFGHITIRENGPLCNCGNRGCLEALVSTEAIQARVQEALDANVYSSLRERGTPADLPALSSLYEAALAGDKLANMVIAEVEDNIGTGIANLINVFDPGTVILSGEVIFNFHELILEGIRRIVGRRAMHTIAHRTAIQGSSLSGDTAARGAATLVIERFLRNEIVNL